MSKRTAFFLGGLGGLLPVLASVLAVDLAPIIDHPGSLTLGNYLGYAIRVVVLIILGGTMALLNDEVRQPLTLVQLGIAAPALITAYINGAALAPNTKNPTVTKSMTLFITPAQADEVASKPIQLSRDFFRMYSGVFRVHCRPYQSYQDHPTFRHRPAFLRRRPYRFFLIQSLPRITWEFFALLRPVASVLDHRVHLEALAWSILLAGLRTVLSQAPPRSEAKAFVYIRRVPDKVTRSPTG
jgi:hypothetical protein